MVRYGTGGAPVATLAELQARLDEANRLLAAGTTGVDLADGRGVRYDLAQVRLERDRLEAQIAALDGGGGTRSRRLIICPTSGVEC